MLRPESGRGCGRRIVFRSVGLIRPGRQQELNAEVAEEIRLIAPGRFQAASGHEEKDDWAMDFVAATNVQGRLDFGWMERPLVIELDVAFKF